jgi:hypothetical protein
LGVHEFDSGSGILPLEFNVAGSRSHFLNSFAPCRLDNRNQFAGERFVPRDIADGGA